MSPAIRSYRVSEAFPRHERFGLTSQLRRAAVSVHLGFVREAQVEVLTRVTREAGQLVMALVHALERPQGEA